MAAISLTIHIFDQNSVLLSTRTLRAVDPATYRPIDLIQLIYQKGVKISNPNGSTIWKMGRCVINPVDSTPSPGRLFPECTPLGDPANNYHPGDPLTLVEVSLI